MRTSMPKTRAILKGVGLLWGIGVVGTGYARRGLKRLTDRRQIEGDAPAPTETPDSPQVEGSSGSAER